MFNQTQTDMKTKFLKSIRQLACLMVMSWILAACNQDNVSHPKSMTSQQQANTAAEDNGQMIASTQDVMDITAGAMTGQGISNGRFVSTERSGPESWDCGSRVSGTFNIDKSHSDSLIYQGTITIDYGDGSNCKDSVNIRRGIIIDSFTFILTRSDFDLTESISFQDFHRDTIQLDGTFISKSSSRDKSTVEIQNARITYKDGTFNLWNGMLTILVGPATEQLGIDDFHFFKSVTGGVTGTTRSGAAFTAEITNDIIFLYSCSRRFPVSGTIKVTVDDVTSTVDYGNGRCDRQYTVSNGDSTTLHCFGKLHI